MAELLTALSSRRVNEISDPHQHWSYPELPQPASV